MADDPDHRGYETPLMADVETGYRRLLRFQLKVIVVFVLVLAVIGGIVFVVIVARDDDAKTVTVTVPDVRGFDHVAVASVFTRAGLAPDYIAFDRASENVTVGRVISTDPPPGTSVRKGTVIKVTFSCGTPQPGFCNP